MSISPSQSNMQLRPVLQFVAETPETASTLTPSDASPPSGSLQEAALAENPNSLQETALTSSVTTESAEPAYIKSIRDFYLTPFKYKKLLASFPLTNLIQDSFRNTCASFAKEDPLFISAVLEVKADVVKGIRAA